MVSSGGEIRAPLTRAHEMARLYTEEGLSLRQLGERFGISHERVRQILEKAGVIRRSSGSGPSPGQLAQRSTEAACLYVQGLTLAEIGARLGVDAGRTVPHLLDKAGVPPRAGRSALSRSHLAQRTEQMLRLRLEEGLTHREIGARLGISEGMVGNTLRRIGMGLSGEQRMQRNREIVHSYVNGGLRLQEVGACFGLHKHTVAEILDRAGVRSRASRPTRGQQKQRDEDVVRLYVEERLFHREIGARIGLSISGVATILRRAGVQGRRTSNLRLTHEELVQRNQEVVRMHLEEGLTPKEISGRLGLSWSRVYAILRAPGMSRSRRHRPVEPPEQAPS